MTLNGNLSGVVVEAKEKAELMDWLLAQIRRYDVVEGQERDEVLAEMWDRLAAAAR